MILGSFLRALGQLGDPRFRRVLALGLGLTVLLLGAVYGLALTAIGWFVPDEVVLPWIGAVGGVNTAIGWASVPLMLIASVFLMVPVASAFCGIFLDDVADAVEARHYPALPVAPRVPFGLAVVDGINFFGVVVGANVLALFLLPFVGPLAPLLFWAVNGYLLGREYFTLAALRRVGRPAARQMWQANRGRLWLAGILMALPLSIPLVNLLVPVVGAATFTHLFHRLRAAAPSGPPSRDPAR